MPRAIRSTTTRVICGKLAASPHSQAQSRCPPASSTFQPLMSAVNGNRLYGQWPTVALGGPEDIGQGRLLPTTPVDRYAATLARWFGASASDLTTVLPNLSRFVTAANAPMGFLPVS